jgi:hypothetical protein
MNHIFAQLVDRLHGGARAILRAIPFLVILVLFIPSTLTTITTQHSGALPALRYVRKHWQPGDRIAARAPALPYLVLGHCDYFVAFEHAFIWETEQGPVNPHLGLPWINSEEGLHQIADESPRLWIIVRTHFADRYRDILGDRVRAVFQELDTLVYITRDEGR